MTRVILVLVLMMVIARAFWLLVDGVIGAAGGTTRRGRKAASAVKLVRDPVCGTYVTPRDSLSLTQRGATHYFCSEQCMSRYRKGA